jgi:hypothetical protein
MSMNSYDLWKAEKGLREKAEAEGDQWREVAERLASCLEDVGSVLTDEDAAALAVFDKLKGEKE